MKLYTFSTRSCLVRRVRSSLDFASAGLTIYQRYAPQDGFGADIRTFATAVVELQEKRHAADYDPMVQMKQSDAILVIGTARAALARFQSANADERAAFLTLLCGVAPGYAPQDRQSLRR